jgi:hypothetical protein
VDNYAHGGSVPLSLPSAAAVVLATGDVAAAFQTMHQPVADSMTSCGLVMDQSMMMPDGMTSRQ